MTSKDVEIIDDMFKYALSKVEIERKKPPHYELHLTQEMANSAKLPNCPLIIPMRKWGEDFVVDCVRIKLYLPHEDYLVWIKKGTIHIKKAKLPTGAKIFQRGKLI